MLRDTMNPVNQAWKVTAVSTAAGRPDSRSIRPMASTPSIMNQMRPMRLTVMSPIEVRGLALARARRWTRAWTPRWKSHTAVTPAHANNGHPAATNTGSARARTRTSTNRTARRESGA